MLGAVHERRLHLGGSGEDAERQALLVVDIGKVTTSRGGKKSEKVTTSFLDSPLNKNCLTKENTDCLYFIGQ